MKKIDITFLADNVKIEPTMKSGDDYILIEAIGVSVLDILMALREAGCTEDELTLAINSYAEYWYSMEG